jgi:predicted permease
MLARLRSLIDGIARRRRFEDDMRAEMLFHVQARADELTANGLSPAEAERRARMEFGTVDAIEDDCRQSRGLRVIDTTGQDLRYAFRLMRRTPGFTAAAILSLALGIGANTTIFTLVDAVMLRTLPVSRPHELVFLAHGNGDNPGTSSNYPLFERYRPLTNVFSGVTAFSTAGVKVPTGDGVESVDSLWVSGNFHAVLCVPMARGRGFSSEVDRQPGGSLIAVISDAYWSRRFARAPDIIGRPLVVDGRTVTIVGVTAPEFTGMVPGTRSDITLPISIRALGEPDFLDSHDTWTSMPIVARLTPGVAETQALAVADVALRQYMSEPENQWIVQRNPGAFAAARFIPAGKGGRALRQRYAVPLMVLMTMVALILVIASANVANLMLVRGEARAREVAIRLCVGGGRRRLIRQFMTESLLLAIAGAAAGYWLARLGAAAIMALFGSLEAPVLLDVTPNARVLAFTTAVALVTALLFGLLPALRSTQVDLTAALKDGARPGGHQRRWATGHALLVAQLALGVLVIAVAGLFARTLHNLKTLDAGFDGGDVLIFTLDSYGTRLESGRRIAIYDELLDRLRALPGVTHGAASRSVPIHASGNARALNLPGSPETMLDRSAWTNMVTPGYFDTFGIRLLRGRDFTNRDVSGAVRVAVINESMARLYFGARDPMGGTVSFMSEPAIPYTVVGVVEDTRQMNLREAAPATIYTPLTQEAESPARLHFEIRTAGDPLALAAAAQDAARSVSRDVVIRYVRTLDAQVNASLVRERLLASLSGAFAVLALVLGAVGLHGVMSYHVNRRGREIGIRMALGAGRGNVLWQVMRQALQVTVAGVAIGVGAALVTTRFLSSLLFDLSERDPFALWGAVGLLFGTALIAAYFPARRAAHLDPVSAIRTE